MLTLKGKTSLITGGSRNIGKAIALCLAKCGCNIIICAREYKELNYTAQEINKIGISCLPIKADVKDSKQVEYMIKKGIDEFGKIDILVNNVGIRPRSSLLEISNKEWEDVINTNLTSAFYCIRTIVPYMQKQKWGRIINIAGVSAFMGKKNRAHVVASKAGLHGLTKALVHELSSYGITVNTISPGYIDTTRPMELYPELKNPSKLLERIPVGRFGFTTEIGKTVVFLSSDYSAYITGQVIHVNGGFYMT